MAFLRRVLIRRTSRKKEIRKVADYNLHCHYYNILQHTFKSIVNKSRQNRKGKGGAIEYKKIPRPNQAREYIDFNKPIEYPIAQHKTAEIIKKALGDNLTTYNLRHTFATICAEHVREEIVEVWLGDSPERLTGKVYVRYSDKFMRKQMNLIKFITD